MITIEKQDLLDIIHYARRYCDGRNTYCVDDFNRIYDSIYSKWIKEHDVLDKTLTEKGKYFPYAKDGMFNK